MKYLIIICLLTAACTSTRKSIKQEKQEISKSLLSFVDSLGRMSVDSTSTTKTTGWVINVSDSGYNKVIEEEVKEVIDSGVIRRETKRLIKEKGQKRVDQSAVTIKNDSTDKKVNQEGAVTQVRKEDSTAVMVTKIKDVKRTSFLSWWLWLIALVAAVLAWWKRNSLIELFT